MVTFFQFTVIGACCVVGLVFTAALFATIVVVVVELAAFCFALRRLKSVPMVLVPMVLVPVVLVPVVLVPVVLVTFVVGVLSGALVCVDELFFVVIHGAMSG